MANVYADRIRELADRREFEMILGWVIAHELGHLLLGKHGHAAAGSCMHHGALRTWNRTEEGCDVVPAWGSQENTRAGPRADVERQHPITPLCA